jgi:hypothetical protein
MNNKKLNIDSISSSVLHLAGRIPTDPELMAFLSAVGAWPLDDFPPDEFNIYFEDKALGFCLLFEDAAIVRNPIAIGKPARTPIFVGCYYYSQGKDGYQQFMGSLPFGVDWIDTPISILAKLGTAKKNILNQKTGQLIAHRWEIDGLLLTVGYKNDVIEDVYVGIK